MKKIGLALALAAIVLFPAAGICGGDLDAFLSDLNVEARADLVAFKVRVGATFGIPHAQVEAVFGEVRTPADAYMVLKVGQVARQPQDIVIREYKANRGKGWGAIAKNLGIKPGSAEFHELKKGWGGPGKGGGKGKDKGKGKGKAKKDKG
ncbi:MAG: hypothetical protein AB1346_02830 [Thermodesulfobacteriota bacterium]